MTRAGWRYRRGWGVHRGGDLESVSTHTRAGGLAQLQVLEVKSQLADLVIQLLDFVAACLGGGGGGEGGGVAGVPDVGVVVGHRQGAVAGGGHD